MSARVRRCGAVFRALQPARAGVLAAAALALASVACGGAETNRPEAPRTVQRIERANASDDRSRCDASLPGRTASEYDTNSDGVADVRRVYQRAGQGPTARSILVCREVDLNYDGTKDLFRFYNDEGRVVREEEDRNFDGRIDVVTYFENGEVVRREHDTSGDGRVDMRIFYRERRPYRAERQLRANVTGEFRPDYWEYYDNNGRVVRMGWDYNGDERADRWDRVDRITPTNREGVGVPAEGAAAPSAAPEASAGAGSGG